MFQHKRTRKSSSSKQYFHRLRRPTNLCFYVIVCSTLKLTNSERNYLTHFPLECSFSTKEDVNDDFLSRVDEYETTFGDVILGLVSKEPRDTIWELSPIECNHGLLHPDISKLRAGHLIDQTFVNDTTSTFDYGAQNNVRQDKAITLENDMAISLSLRRRLSTLSPKTEHIDQSSEHSYRDTPASRPVTPVHRGNNSSLYDSSSRHHYSALLTSSRQDYTGDANIQTSQKQYARSQEQSGNIFMPNMYHDFSIQQDLPPILKPDILDPNNNFQTTESFLDYEEETSYTPNEEEEEKDEEEEDDDAGYAEDEKYPVIYRYFGRSRTRSIRDESIPYIILCPNVDHFKVVGQILSSRGFHTMVCQRVISDRGKMDDTSVQGKKLRWGVTLPWNRRNQPGADSVRNMPTDGTKLVSAILKVLKWKKAVLIGCGAEAILAIEAALHLAPDRVAGLIICGDLTAAYERASEFLEESITSAITSFAATFQERERRLFGPWSLDMVLEDYITCPATIIWDGDSTALMSSKIRGEKSSSLDGNLKPMVEKLEAKRSVIIGGGSAPYRKLPEQFSWTCTRFVEKELLSAEINPVNRQDETENIDDSITDEYDMEEYDNENESELDSSNYSYNSSFWSKMVPDDLARAFRNMFNPGSLVVSGRMVASVVIYVTMARVVIFHYRNAIHGLAELRSSYLNLSTWWQQLASFFVSCIPVLSKDIPTNGNIIENNPTNDDGIDPNTDQEKESEESLEEDSPVRKLFFYDQIFT